MSSRQEEKEQRRKEREERERAAAAKAKRSRLLQLIGGVVVACAIIAGVAVAVSSGGGDGDDGGADVDTGKLKAAAQSSGCVYRAFPDEGQDHVTEPLTEADFKTNPPTSGGHNPEPAPDGLYVAGNEPAIENWVHTLEHGRVIIQYRPGIERSVVTQLEALFNEDVKGSGGAYHSVLMRNNTKMPFEVAAVAWRHYMACREFTPKSIEALRTFREELIDKGPETVP
ncbi:MAG TPA: DUF3105 domain-containing protein [Solirubrobacteraceae bacterium]|nr:DUF3105 domain-containing protein [Solirubrobacteraceae bacterium]